MFAYSEPNVFVGAGVSVAVDPNRLFYSYGTVPELARSDEGALLSNENGDAASSAGVTSLVLGLTSIVFGF